MQALWIPLYSWSRKEIEIFLDIPRVIKTLLGVPPIAAMSLWLTAFAFWPNCSGEIVEDLK